MIQQNGFRVAEIKYMVNRKKNVFREIGIQFFYTAMLLLLCLGLFQKAEASDPPKLLLIHLDAVSIHVLQEEIQAGNLPEIENYFSETGLLERAITYYPSKTPFVISNIRDATPSSEGPLVGWEIPEYEDTESLTLIDSFLKMALSKHRPARANLIYGLPLFNRLNKAALMNTLDLFDEYPVIEFYWYAIDTFGHFYGEVEYRNKLREFDTAIGQYLSKLDDDINVIIYSDHGMVFGRGIEIDKDIKESFGHIVETFSYPSIYLHKNIDTDDAARTLLQNTELDFTFYKLSDEVVKGYSEKAVFYFTYRDNAVQYTYEGEDPFDYYENGYNGEFLTADEWLLFSFELSYPATPVKVFNYLMNPNSGDIAVSFNDQKYAKTIYSSVGNHGGFTATELLVPVMVRGPDVDYIGDFEVLWLQELFYEVQDFEFGQNPSRDRHYISSGYDFRNESTTFTAAISPIYRTNFGTDLSFDNHSSLNLQTIWGRYDLYRSYIARLWFGGGIDFRKEDTVGMMFLKHEIRIRDFTARSTLNTSGIHTFTLGYNLFPYTTVELTNFTTLGLRISF